MSTAPAYAELCKLLKEAATLGSVSNLLAWDQETYMPPAANDARGDQRALLAGLTHERRTSPRIGELLQKCESDATLTADGTPEAANLREIRRDYDLATKLPKDLVEEWAKTSSESQHVWKEAREKSDFKRFAPYLEKMIALARRKAECYGVPKGGEAYDALLNEYEPGATGAMIEKIFTPLRADLSKLIQEVKDRKKKVSTRPIEQKLATDKQHAFGLAILDAIKFDRNAGRLDVTTHPFCEGLAPGDTRLTTRYRGEKFTDALYGTLHEAGHGIYEQGLPKSTHFGQPLAEAVSLGIHESQSRMWENFVGRSKAFWKWALPRSRKHFGKVLQKFDHKDLFTAVNTVTPSFVRVEADETTYNLHVMVRFEIERAMLNGRLKVADIPEEWNRRYKDYLGVKVPNEGRFNCLQDVHWSFGLMGYFPTYALGNMYAAQFWDKINLDIPDLNKHIAKGEFGPLKTWLNNNIHRHGRRYRAAELCERITGQPLTSEPLLRHLRGKAEAVYGI